MGANRTPSFGRLPGRPAYKIAGVPPDLLRLAARLGAPTREELCAAFYLPAALTAAFIELGLARRAWTPDQDGRLRSAPSPAAVVTSPPPASGFAQTVWTAMQRRDELTQADPVLLLAPEPALAAALAPGRPVWVLDPSAPAATAVPAGVTQLRADLRTVHGFTFGAFAQVICPPQLGGPSAPVLHTALANLAIHGTLYLGLSLTDRERGAVIEALSRLENAVILTDLTEELGTLLFRGVKYPELRGNPEFMRYYVD